MLSKHLKATLFEDALMLFIMTLQVLSLSCSCFSVYLKVENSKFYALDLESLSVLSVLYICYENQ